MQNKIVEVNGIKIAYVEKNKEAKQTIFFIHGNSMSKRSWYKQYDSHVLSHWRLIVIDIPSHGDSEKAAASDCSLKGLGAIMASAINLLANNRPYIIAGMSLGTNIIAEMLAYNIIPAGLVLASPCIVSAELRVETFAKPGTHVGVV
jgi:pimeloyl-ACP methyl ester carboxylesterase